MKSLGEIIKDNNPYSWKEKIKEQNERNARAEVIHLGNLTYEEKQKKLKELFEGR